MNMKINDLYHIDRKNNQEWTRFWYDCWFSKDIKISYSIEQMREIFIDFAL